MTNFLNDGAYGTDQNKRCQDVQVAIVANDFNFASTSVDEILLSNLGHVRTNSRVTFKRVTNSSQIVGTGEKIGVVHSSAVSTTRRGSSPSEVSLSVDLNGHAVFGFYLLNQIPGSGDLFGWVNNLDAFIKEQNIGLKEEQVRTKSSSSTDSKGQDDLTAVEKALNNKSDKEGDQNPATGNRTSGSELFTIRHFASFSQMGSTK